MLIARRENRASSTVLAREDGPNQAGGLATSWSPVESTSAYQDASFVVGYELRPTVSHWHRLELGAKGGHFVVRFDSRVLFEADDATFPDSGKVGLWTKADSVTCFDNLGIGLPE